MTRKVVQKRTPWQMDDMHPFVDGTADPKGLLEYDSRGLNPVAYSALKTAIITDRLQELLDETPSEGEDPIQAIKDLLESIAEGQIRLEGKLDRLTEALLVESS